MDYLTSLCKEVLYEISSKLSHQELYSLARCSYYYLSLLCDRSLVKQTLLNTHHNDEGELAKHTITALMHKPNVSKLRQLDLILSFYPHWSLTPVILKVSGATEFYEEGFNGEETFYPLELIHDKATLLLLLKYGADLSSMGNKGKFISGNDAYHYADSVEGFANLELDVFQSTDMPIPWTYRLISEEMVVLSWRLLTCTEGQDVDVYQRMVLSSHYNIYTNLIIDLLLEMLPLYPRRASILLNELKNQDDLPISSYFIVAYLLRHLSEPYDAGRGYTSLGEDPHILTLFRQQKQGGNWWKTPILKVDYRNFPADYYFGRGYLAVVSLLQPLASISLQLVDGIITSSTTIQRIYGHPVKSFMTDGLPHGRYTTNLLFNGKRYPLQYDHHDFYLGCRLACVHWGGGLEREVIVDHLSLIPEREQY